MKSIKKQVILLITTFVFALTLCGAVAAEGTSTGGDSGGTDNTQILESQQQSDSQDNQQDSTDGSVESNTNSENSDTQNSGSTSQNGLVDPQVLVIHSSTTSLVTNVAAHNILSTINPTQPGYNANDPSTWTVRFDVRTSTQIGAMSKEDLKNLISNADIIICEWIFNPAMDNFYNVITDNPGILNNKPNKIFLVLESDPKLTKLSQINGVPLFNGVPDNVLGSTSTTGTILNALYSNNVAQLNTYKTTYPQIAAWIDAGLYYASKGQVNYENQFKMLLKNFTTSNGGTWPVAWEPAAYNPNLPKETIYRMDSNGNREIFTTLASYLAKYPLDPSKPTIGLIEMGSNLLASNLQHFEYITAQLVAKGFNVIPIVAEYSGTTGSPAKPLNIYSAMVKFLVYDPTKDSISTANYVVTTTEYEANPQNYKYRIDSLVDFFTFSVGSGYLTQINALLNNMNVPVFRAMTSTKKSEGEWIVSDDGLMWSDTYYQIALPEVQGIIEPIFVATTDKQVDTVTGAELGLYHAIPDRVEKLVNRVSNWTQLKYMDNANKKIALVYYNYPPGKQNIGASYLNTPESILNILNLLKDQGYTVTDIPQTSDELVSLMIRNGINVANWAPGELETLANDPRTILWDADEYNAWFATLDPVAQKQVTEGPVGYIEEITKLGVEYAKTNDLAISATIKNIDKWTQEMVSLVNTYPALAQQGVALVNEMSNALKNVINNINLDAAWNSFYTAKNAFMLLAIPGLTGWGPAPGNVMTVNKNGKKYFVIPGLKFGNIFIGPEPQRGWEADSGKFYHSTVVPPTHQYLAWYAWVNNVYNADAQVHVGRHASYEWLPSKEVALSRFDYSDITIADTPSIYLYIVDGVGEGLQAKRRGLAVIIDHLTPPLTTTSMDYGGFPDLKTAIDNYQKTLPGNPLKDAYLAEIKQRIKDMNLATDLQLTNVDNLSDKDVDKLQEYILNLEQTLMPYGLHTFGVKWSNKEIALLATSMVSADAGASNPSLQRLLAQKNGWDFDNLTLAQAELLNDQAQEWVLLLFTGQKTAADLTSDVTLQNKLNEALGYANKINDSFLSETNALIDALKGGYVTPSTGSDPVRNTGALPTGKNFYSTDDSKLPTKTAWALGKKLADMALAQLDSTPEKIAAVVWCVETARDDGTMASFVLRMLGIEPTWTSTGGVDKMVATPLSTLLTDLNAVRTANGQTTLTQRPRIDVVVTTSGLFRDLFPRLLINMDRANRVALAASYNQIILNNPELQLALKSTLQTLVDAKYTVFDSNGNFVLKGALNSATGNDLTSQNYIAKHWVDLVKQYIAQGYSASDAGELAITRIFAPAVGDYGAGVNKAVEQSWTWDNREEVADVYINKMSHSYTEKNWGTSNPDLFKNMLKGIDTAYHSRSTNLYGVLDNDDYYDYYGGLSMAIEKMNNGKAPNLNVLYYANPARPQVMSLETFMTQEMRTRYYNPEWIQGMMGEGYSGARYISNKFTSYLWGWQVTSPNTVKNWMWDEIVDTYIKDQYNLGVDNWLSSGNNAYSLISITGTLLTAANKGYWKTDDATLRLVTNTWANAIAQNGVACCDCSCGNLAMIEWATQYINPDILAQFNAQMYKATMNPSFAPNQANPQKPSSAQTQGSASGKKVSAASSTNPSSGDNQQQSDAGQSPGDQGEKAYEVSKSDSSSSSSQTGMPIAAIVGVVLIIGLVGVGYFRADILSWFRK